MRKHMKIIPALIFALLMMVTISFGDTIPQLINYNGTLSDPSGNPVPDGSYNIAFNIYDASVDGNILWSEVWNDTTVKVVVTDGSFNAMLGAHTPIPATFFSQHPTIWLGITVDTDSEMLPRQRITSVGYAFHAGNGTPRGGIIMWSGAVNDIPDGWALCDGTNNTPDLRNRFVIGAGNSYDVGTSGGSITKNFSHTHKGPSHTHSGPSHRHYCDWTIGPYPQGNDFDDEVEDGDEDTPAGSDHQHRVQLYTEYEGTGQTGASGTGNTSAAGSANQDIMPPYYALCFIMKL